MKRFNKWFQFSVISCIAFMLFLPNSTVSADMHSLENKLDDYISQNEDTTAGLAIMIIQDNEVVVRKSIGFANSEKNLKVNEESVFEWGSVSKIVIWISVMQLVEDGLIDLNQDIRHYLPESFPLPTKFEEPIQLLHLMNHTAGFDDSYTDLVLYNPSEMLSLKETLNNTDVKQVFRPGEIMAYSNYGAALAAFIVENVSGQDYVDYVNEHVFEPLKMKHTSIDPLQNANEWVKSERKKIQGYTLDNQPITPDLYAIPLYPAGSIMGTIDDLALLVTAFLSEKGSPLFKKEDTIDLLFEPSAFYPGTNIPRIAHGFLSLPAETKTFGHSGNTIAFTSSLYLSREKRLGVIVMTNQSNETNFSFGIPELVFGKPEFSAEVEKLENSAPWTGIYQAARVPYHGFSKMYGLANRFSVKQNGQHNLMTNGFLYTQQHPGIYSNKEEFSMYARDVYSVHPEYGNILSTSLGDHIQISLKRHLFEWAMLIAGLAATLFSVVYSALILVPKFRKRAFHIVILILIVLNLLVVSNVAFMIYKTLSMTTYESLKVHMMFTIIYVILISVFIVTSLFLKKKLRLNKTQNIYFFVSILSAILLCVNLVYWEFYR
ncbi:serine hydrolase domain-containing protein [Sporosarcina siberiensis]|uniref:Serine hydrolase domain-containing protein n=1 Tax=Sporosarcina siberiensis TaxID=1365606 RepID=A0ABW4SBJ1_9BACL